LTIRRVSPRRRRPASSAASSAPSADGKDIDVFIHYPQITQITQMRDKVSASLPNCVDIDK
jgi:hypothetical protein